MDREIVREGDGGANVILWIVIAIVAAILIYLVATGRMNFGNPATENSTTDINITTETPATETTTETTTTPEPTPAPESTPETAPTE